MANCCSTGGTPTAASSYASTATTRSGFASGLRTTGDTWFPRTAARSCPRCPPCRRRAGSGCSSRRCSRLPLHSTASVSSWQRGSAGRAGGRVRRTVRQRPDVAHGPTRRPRSLLRHRRRARCRRGRCRCRGASRAGPPEHRRNRAPARPFDAAASTRPLCRPQRQLVCEPTPVPGPLPLARLYFLRPAADSTRISIAEREASARRPVLGSSYLGYLRSTGLFQRHADTCTAVDASVRALRRRASDQLPGA